MLKYFLITALLFCLIFLLVTPISAANNYTISILITEILATELSDSTIIYLKQIKAPSKYNQYVPEFEKQLLQTLIDNGYTITRNNKINTSVRLSVEIENIEFDNQNKLFLIFLSLKLENVTLKKIVIDRKAAVYFEKQDSNWIKFKPIGDLNYLSGGEVEPQNFTITKVYANRTASWNERDLQAGIRVQFPGAGINSVLLLRTRSSFGRDDLKLYKVYFETNNFLCGIFPLQFGIHSRYLNSTVQRPYWNTGLIFNSEVSGFSASLNYKYNKFTFYWATNRNPSLVIASKWNITAFKKRLNCSLSAIYVARDDIFNDVGRSLGFEIKYQQGNKLFLYGVTAIKSFYSGSTTDLQRKIIPLLVEYQYSLTKKWILKGAYLSVNQWIINRHWSVEETIYQEVAFQASKHWAPGIQYEHFYIDDFWENNFTAVFYYNPWNFYSDGIRNIGAAFKLRYIDSKFGGNLFFFGVEGRFRF